MRAAIIVFCFLFAAESSFAGIGKVLGDFANIVTDIERTGNAINRLSPKNQNGNLKSVNGSSPRSRNGNHNLRSTNRSSRRDRDYDDNLRSTNENRRKSSNSGSYSYRSSTNRSTSSRSASRISISHPQLPAKIMYGSKSKNDFSDDDDALYYYLPDSNNADQQDTNEKNIRKFGNNSGRLIKRSSLFNDQRAKLLCISPMGKRIAYVSHENGQDVVNLQLLKSSGHSQAIFKEIHNIESIKFPSEGWIALTIRNEANYLDLVLFDLRKKKYHYVRLDENNIENNENNIENDESELENYENDFETNEKGIRNMELKTAPNTQNIAVRAFNGEEYFTYIVKIPSLEVQLIKKNRIPEWILLDDSLHLVGYYKNFQRNSADVFVDTIVRSENQDQKISKKIDRIDFNTEKCVAIKGDSYYKIKKDGNRIQLIIQNLVNNRRKTILLNARNASGNSNALVFGTKTQDYKIHFDANGTPAFFTRTAGIKTNVSMSNAASSSVNRINQEFSNSSWSKIDETCDDVLWLLKVDAPCKHTSYFLFDTQRKLFTEIASANQPPLPEPLANVSRVQIPVGGAKNGNQPRDSIVYGYLAKASSFPKAQQTKAPLIIFAEADGKHKFSWEFDGMMQLLVDRGFNVLCVNCFTKHPNDGPVITQQKIQNMTANIMSVVNWCLNTHLVQRGRIMLVGKRANGIYCTNAFINNQQLFSGCIALTTNFPDIADPLIDRNNSENSVYGLQKPLILINDQQSAQKYDTVFSDMKASHEDNAPQLAYVAYNGTPNDSDVAAILEESLCSTHNFTSEPVDAEILSSFNILFNGTQAFESIDYSTSNTEYSNYRYE